MFFQVAREGENKWWQYLVTIIVVFIGWQIVGGIPLVLGAYFGIGEEGDLTFAFEQFTISNDFADLGLDAVTGLTLLILSFGMGIVFLWLMLKWLHKRPFLSLITPQKSINWRKIFTAAAIWFSFMAIFEIGSYFYDPSNYTFQADWSKFGILILVCIFLLPLQTSFEELLMRGYMMQGLGLAFGNRLIALLVPAILFALMHGFNPEVMEYGFEIMMVNYFSIGLMLGIITLMDDSLELALGVHWANNFYGATMVTFSGSALNTPALFRMENLNINAMTIAAVSASIIFVFILSKIYGWVDWTKIYGEVRRERV